MCDIISKLWVCVCVCLGWANIQGTHTSAHTLSMCYHALSCVINGIQSHQPKGLGLATAEASSAAKSRARVCLYYYYRRLLPRPFLGRFFVIVVAYIEYHQSHAALYRYVARLCLSTQNAFASVMLVFGHISCALQQQYIWTRNRCER